MNQHIHNLVDIAIDLEFEVNSIFYDLNDDQLEKIYNGCGPDWLPVVAREKLTDYLSFFEAAFLEHDVSFQISDSTKEGFDEANKRLYINCKKLANEVSWLTPLQRARRYWQAYLIYRACQRLGWSAYKK